MLLELQYHQLLQEPVAHEELFSGARNVAVVVHDTHSCETSNLNLNGDVLVHVGIEVSLLGWERSHTGSSLPIDEALVSDFINHLLFINYSYYYVKKLISDTTTKSEPPKSKPL